jgi:ectoine hydroxylase-related dioxygenase (phytanoyl-CoA dioxygenase family)
MTSEATSAATQMSEEGFAILDGLFTEEEIRPVSDEVDNIIAGRATYLPPHELVYEPGSNPQHLRNTFRMHLYKNLFMSVARTPKLVKILEEMLGRPLRIYGSHLFAKLALVGTAVPPHQDMPYWPFAPAELISAWIALDDSTIANGCVRFLAGSHRLGLLAHEPSGVTGNSLRLAADERLHSLAEKAVEVRRGSVVLHHCLTVHRSEPNQSTRSRRGLIYIYMFPQCTADGPIEIERPAGFPEVSRPGSDNLNIYYTGSFTHD